MPFKRIARDIKAILDRDPAVRSRIEVVLCYPGFHALIIHRMANWLWRHKLFLAGRFMSHVGRVLTGIEIHPAATVGEGVFIDHGMGVVIGETSVIGDNVTIYQGATLGGTTWERGKRHPTLHNDVIVGAGAKVLGPITIGSGARIGSNAVVVKDVRAGAAVVGVPAKEIARRRDAIDPQFIAYGTSNDIPDPVARALDGLLDHVTNLSARVEALEEEKSRLQAALDDRSRIFRERVAAEEEE
ncbi:MAG: serine O-acetyltransferase [Rhodospirillaceae bacterium]|nr:serine O-acetyltransferase [Rhodospirillaceae bacterium]